MRVLLWSLCFFLVSCNGNILFQERAEISGSSWSYDSPLIYSFNISDTSELYDVFLNVQHSRDFGYQNLYTALQTISPGGDTLFQRISVNLSDDYGEWLGTCKGNECSNQILIRKSTPFSKTGSYKILLNQHSRVNNLEGIKSIELTIAATKD